MAESCIGAGGYEVTFLPNHLANEEFPFTMEELKQYDLVILSDIGANTCFCRALRLTAVKKCRTAAI